PGIRPVHDPARELAAVVIEAHVEKLRAHTRSLPRRTLPAAPEEPPDAEATWPERRPAEQAGAEDAERNSYRKFAAQAGKGRDRQRDDAAHDLDAARVHDGIGCTKHLQQQVKQDNGDDAGNQGWHDFNIVASAPKSIAGRPWQTTL